MGKMFRFNKYIKGIISSLLFPDAVIIVLIITYYITTCKDVNNLRNNLKFMNLYRKVSIYP